MVSDVAVDAELAKGVCVQPSFRNGRYVRCASSDAASCYPCSRIHARDTRRLIEAGFEVGVDSAFFLLTLTAPSFGKVHKTPRNAGAVPVRCDCGEIHEFGSSLAGVPLDMKNYRYADQLRWNEHSSKLFHSTIARVRSVVPVVEHCAVREYQQRAAIHIHALIRVDAEDTEKAWMALRETRFTRSGGFAWGRSSDVQLLSDAEVGDTADYLTKVCGYFVKTIGASADCLSVEQREHILRLDKSAVRQRFPEKKMRGFGYGGNTFSQSRGWSGLSKTSLKVEAVERAKSAVAVGDVSSGEGRSVAYARNVARASVLGSELGLSGRYEFDVSRVERSRRLLMFSPSGG